MRIAILERQTYGEDVSFEIFSKYGQVDVYSLQTDEPILDRLKDIDVVLCNKYPMNKQTLTSSVKLILQTGTGYNNIDLDYCNQNHIAVCNVAGYSTKSVAQHTFALALSLLEHLQEYDTMVKDLTYSKSGVFSIFVPYFSELAGKVWGIIGLGAIGKEVAKIAQAFGCRVIFYSTSGRNIKNEYEQVDFETLLKESDIVSIHAALTEKNRYLMDINAFKKMKSNAILINVARGPFVNEKDLVYAIDHSLIAGAGLDVMEQEPLPLSSPLLQIQKKNRILLTPHMAWGSKEARTRLIDELVLNLESYLLGKRRNRIDNWE
ncbi:MAG: NAD(P)-dependent oxidoreductase [Bacillota bacterium]|nr:NAD(P)-dependent oxidoreductase [Bacillota bacterium]